MKRYIEQLIEDLRAAALNKPTPGDLWDSVDMQDQGELEDMAHVEQLLYDEEYPLSKIVGIDHMYLPPPDRLTDAQRSLLLDEIIALLKAFNFVPEYPEDLPVYLKYKVLRDAWETQLVPVSAGEVHIEFCNYYPPECPFTNDYCICRHLEEEEAQNKEDQSDWPTDEDLDDLPF